MPVAIEFEVDRSSLQRLQDRLNRFRRTPLSNLNDDIAAEVVSQTQRRISTEKTDPEGKAWQAWSKNYAETRHSGHSLLMNEGNLLTSIIAERSGSEVVVGSPLEYAAAQQMGYSPRNLVARPYLGIAQKNETSLLQILDDWADRAMSRIFS